MTSKSSNYSDRKPWIALQLSGWFSLAMACIFISAYKSSDAAIPAGLAFLGLFRIATTSSSAIKSLSDRLDLLEKAKEEADDAIRAEA